MKAIIIKKYPVKKTNGNLSQNILITTDEGEKVVSAWGKDRVEALAKLELNKEYVFNLFPADSGKLYFNGAVEYKKEPEPTIKPLKLSIEEISKQINEENKMWVVYNISWLKKNNVVQNCSNDLLSRILNDLIKLGLNKKDMALRFMELKDKYLTPKEFMYDFLNKVEQNS